MNTLGTHEPVQGLFETAAEVLGGLKKAFSDYEQKNELAWKGRGRDLRATSLAVLSLLFLLFKPFPFLQACRNKFPFLVRKVLASLINPLLCFN